MLGFRHAICGLQQMLRTERNFKVQVVIFIAVVICGFSFGISAQEWTILLLVSALVLSLEIINSAIEKLCDLYSTDYNEKIKIIKDISAGAVFITALFAVLIGVIIFYPYLKALF
ncbi:diacylglycerol kinase family protein [Brumimicrobium aurantiacum]|uniref:Diacylglycerol kinase family protein n=1 Tax=Brumimicrobium aurantiacum TaxID=1737063 RepID=A0A3E1EVQ4_9FLAO|nr:diacylglycerol kinase family protein [Brumimicrobium aurantiacum]RFC53630.1 diacylglycerol kinase family protein [Brumimicrobium aurantiacum]